MNTISQKFLSAGNTLDGHEVSSILCFGELLLRLSPDTEGQWLQENTLPVFIGGAELNVASALAKWNVPVKYFTALPENLLSKQILKHISSKNIQTSAIHFSGDRIGTYYLPIGSDVKNTGVIYDRRNSSFAVLKRGMIDWDKIFQGITWFHFSAICPALSESAADVCDEALSVAHSKKIKISVDLNYRSKLWKYGKEPRDVMPKLVQYCDIVMGNVWAANTMLGIEVDEDLKQKDNKDVYLQQAENTSRAIINQYPKCKAVFNTYRFDHNAIKYYTALFTSNHLYASFEYNSETALDKVGSGDCFMAGLIYGYYNNLHPQEILDFATAAAFQKLFIKGDATDKTAEDVKAFIQKYEY